MRYLDDVFRYSMSRLGNREDAEDIAIEVVQALPSPCNRRDLKTYMIGMARRKVIDRLRRLKPTAVLIRDTEAAAGFEANVEQTTLVAAVLDGLSDQHREVLTLKYVAGLTSAEIGQMLRKRPDAVDSQLQRAREAFTQAWTDLTSDEVKL